MSEQLVIVGNGMAAARLVDELTKRAPGQYAIAVIGEEKALAYNRVLLSSLLAGEVAEEDIELRSRAWWASKGVTLVYGRRATHVDARARQVRLEGGAPLTFSKLVLATGSEPIRLPLPGVGLSG
ncbi:MAG TPA: FAD-dependent oxidoreductase, partial [Methyloceanibacter sp.]|nr:FAD-dependent oxidoreductase [Methyloceanibacter sp.]